MVLKITLDCPACGKVSYCDYTFPDDTRQKERCPFCDSLSDVVGQALVGDFIDPMVIEARVIVPEFPKVKRGRKAED